VYIIKWNTDQVMEDTTARFACLGLGLLFLGRQEAADVTMEALVAVPGQLGKYCSFTVETCAYAGRCRPIPGHGLQLRGLAALRARALQLT